MVARSWPENLRAAKGEQPHSMRGLQKWGVILEWVTFEFFLTKSQLPNGSSVIMLRSLLTALVVYLVLLIGRNLLDPSRTWTFSMHELRVQILGTAQVFGALFAAVYAGLYARFSSQWSYLANVYNQIKAAESRGGCDASRLAEWKAGFIEDAQDLHLALKPLFASVIRAWGSEAEVKGSFETYAPGGALRLAKLMSRVELAWERAGKDWVEKG